MRNCPDGFIEGLQRINGTNMFARICVSQSENTTYNSIYMHVSVTIGECFHRVLIFHYYDAEY